MLQVMKLVTRPEIHFSPDNSINSINQFKYELEWVTFKAYYQRFEHIFKMECNDWRDKMKTCLILKKLGTIELKKYYSFISSKKKGFWHKFHEHNWYFMLDVQRRNIVIQHSLEKWGRRLYHVWGVERTEVARDLNWID